MNQKEIDEIMENIKRACKEVEISFNILDDILNTQHNKKPSAKEVDTSKVLNIPIITGSIYETYTNEELIQKKKEVENEIEALDTTLNTIDNLIYAKVHYRDRK